MFGKNPIRKPSSGNGDFLDIQEIFPTIQGEGPYVGHPAVFVRLGGCNLACLFCDTEFESFKETSLDETYSQIIRLSKINSKIIRKLIVITGGEPFRQPIEKLCERLIKQGYLVQIETNGTLYREIPKEVQIICSPKNTGNGYHRIREDLLSRINAFKFLISKSNLQYNNIAEIGQTEHKIDVYIQPMDEYSPLKNKSNLDYAVKMALDNGYKLSIQTHKILGIQ